MADYITMKQVPGGVVTAKDDRIVYDANMADSGIIYGCGISYVGNNMIHIAAGYGIIKGGLFEMEDHTEYVDLAENEPTTGQIYLHLDLSADDKLTIVKETTNNLHPMVQNANANFTNGIYELQLCTFTATTTALEDVTQTFEVIQNKVLDTLEEIMANTTAGLKAGALALKEVSENLTRLSTPNFLHGVDLPKDNKIRTADKDMFISLFAWSASDYVARVGIRIYDTNNNVILERIEASLITDGGSAKVTLNMPIRKGTRYALCDLYSSSNKNFSLKAFPYD